VDVELSETDEALLIEGYLAHADEALEFAELAIEAVFEAVSMLD